MLLYIDLLDSFVSGKLSGDEFQTRFFQLHLRRTSMLSERVYRCVNELFYVVEDYVPDPILRKHVSDLGEEELLSAALAVLEELKLDN